MKSASGCLHSGRVRSSSLISALASRRGAFGTPPCRSFVQVAGAAVPRRDCGADVSPLPAPRRGAQADKFPAGEGCAERCPGISVLRASPPPSAAAKRVTSLGYAPSRGAAPTAGPYASRSASLRPLQKPDLDVPPCPPRKRGALVVKHLLDPGTQLAQAGVA